ncbi:MAG: RagB/SusD family nutrient uptake outer membrane protein [Candidatus Nephrothrix sp. EaCA]|nr:MAG: RagB/SusD family nutrient uptake outer membrane protein [Candidatus Nephrothrix sp. EaCA]
MKTIVFFIALLVIAGLTGCSKFLGQVPDNILTEDVVFSNRQNAEKFLANIYSRLPNEWGQRWPGGHENRGAWTGGSDEAEYLWDFVGSNGINSGAWDSGKGWAWDYWSSCYTAIRNAAIFMDKIDQVKIDMQPEQKVRYKAEARALRAIYYFYLLRIYGPVILLGDEQIPVDAKEEDILKPRNSVDECVTFIASELDKAAADLPIRPGSDQNYGRITKGIALAFKARTYLQAASPLLNGNTDFAALQNKDGKQLIPQTYDENKWKKAADEYKAFINAFDPAVYQIYRKNDESGNFSPFLSCRDVVLENWCPEVIFGRPVDENARGYECTPFHSGYNGEVQGSGGLGATQKQVDAFFMANGKPITDPSSGYVATGTSQFRAPDDDKEREIFNQWVNREPRFYVSITYDNRKWLNNNTGEVVTRLHFKGNSGKGISNDFCPTGYVVRKGAKVGNWRNGLGVIPLYRLANVYLDYVEALNEYKPGDPDILTYLNKIRERAGIPGYGQGGIAVPVGKEAMRKAIWQERQAELAFENVRFFDTRRWKIAEIEDNGDAYGCDINSPLPGFYRKTAFERRVFQRRHYFFPIPEVDVNTNPLLVQNTGW